MAVAVPRLKRRSEFLRIAGSGQKWAAPGLVLQAWKRSADAPVSGDQPSIRVGFTASRKVGNAVARNRVRRRLRAAADKVLPEMAREGFDFVIIGRAATLNRTFDDLVKDLKTALKRLDACRKNTPKPA